MTTNFRRIINDSEILKNIEIENVSSIDTVTKLDRIIKSRTHIECGTYKISSVYDGFYPENYLDYIDLISIMDELRIPKIIDLLVLIHFSFFKDSVLNWLCKSSKNIYNKIIFRETLKETIISLGLIDLLISQKYTYTDEEFARICGYGHILSVMHILESSRLAGTPIDIHYNNDDSINNSLSDNNLPVFKFLYEINMLSNRLLNIIELFELACNGNNMEIIEYVWKLVNISGDIDTLEYKSVFECVFNNAFCSNNLILAQYLWDISLKTGIHLDIHETDIGGFNLFTYSCSKGHIKMARWLLEISFLPGVGKIDLHANNEKIFTDLCLSGCLDGVNYVLEIDENIDIHANNELGFCNACLSGNKELVKFLWGHGKYEMMINIHANNDTAFQNACGVDIEMVKYILELEFETDGIIDIHANNEKAFQNACYKCNIPLVKFLWKLGIKSGKLIDIHANDNIVFKENKKYDNTTLLVFLNSLESTK